VIELGQMSGIDSRQTQPRIHSFPRISARASRKEGHRLPKAPLTELVRGIGPR